MTAQECFPDLGPLSAEAIDDIQRSADKLAMGEVMFQGRPGFDLWLPIVQPLVHTIAEGGADHRRLATKTLLKILKAHGHLFDVTLWELLFRGVLVNIFASVGDLGADPSPERLDWLLTTCFKALHGLVALFGLFFASIAALLDDVLALLAQCIASANETLATFGVTLLETLIRANADKFAAAHWAALVAHLALVLERTAPAAIFDLTVWRAALKQCQERAQMPAPEPDEPLIPPATVRRLVGQARIQALLLRLISIELPWAQLGATHIDRLMAALAEQAAFRARNNATLFDATLFEVLEPAGLRQLQGLRQLHELLWPIENESMTAYMNCLMRLVKRVITEQRWVQLGAAQIYRLEVALAEQVAFGARVNSNVTLLEGLEAAGLRRQLEEVLWPSENESMPPYLHRLFLLHDDGAPEAGALKD